MKHGNHHLVSIDLETGGLRPDEHTILTIGVYTEIDEEPYSEHFLVEPCAYKMTTDKALEITGIDLENHDGIHEKEVVQRLNDYLRGVEERTGRKPKMIGHNIAGFDNLFLGELERRTGTELYRSRGCIDTLHVARWLNHVGVIDTHGNKLQTLALQLLSLDVEFHNSLGDAEACYKVYGEMKRRVEN